MMTSAEQKDQERTREADLTRFDEARATFSRALMDAPAESLGFLKPGDDYAVGGLLYHANAVLTHYHVVLDTIVTAGFSEVTPKDPPGLFEQANARAREGLNSAERTTELNLMDELHGRVRARALALDAGDWERKAPVRFEPESEPYPTSPQDVVGWLTDHYLEHVPHALQLLEEWRAAER
jgi:hypothetical protein